MFAPKGRLVLKEDLCQVRERRSLVLGRWPRAGGRRQRRRGPAEQLKTRQQTNEFLAVKPDSTNGAHLHRRCALNVNALGLEHNHGDFGPALLVIGILWDLDPYRRRFPGCTTTDSSRKHGVSRGDVGSSRDTSADEPLLWQGRPACVAASVARKRTISNATHASCAWHNSPNARPWSAKSLTSRTENGQSRARCSPRVQERQAVVQLVNVRGKEAQSARLGPEGAAFKKAVPADRQQENNVSCPRSLPIAHITSAGDPIPKHCGMDATLRRYRLDEMARKFHAPAFGTIVSAAPK